MEEQGKKLTREN